ncbi:MAG: ATP-binding cassette domain-containing protein [Enterocloster bolteae]
MITLEHICKTYSRWPGGIRVCRLLLLPCSTGNMKPSTRWRISPFISVREIVGYIGPNGAGKSSTIKIMSGILVPDSGQCHINGMNPWKQRKEYVRDIRGGVRTALPAVVGRACGRFR